MAESLQYVNCLLCGQDRTTVWASADGTERKIVRCRRDGLVYLNPRPIPERVLGFHQNEFIRNDNQELFSSFRRQILRREAQAIKALRPQGGNLLDVGCATGMFFENFPERDWRLYGVDPSRLGVETVRAASKAQIFAGTLCEADYPSGFFDVITLLDTLYYVPDPCVELREAERILRPNGILAVEIPGFNYSRLRNRGPLALVLDGKWRSVDPRSNHLYYFSGRTLRSLLNRAGFRVENIIPEQASVGRGGVLRAINDLHFALCKAIFRMSKRKLSVAGKELYLAFRE